jgi:hypothetical protein
MASVQQQEVQTHGATTGELQSCTMVGFSVTVVARRWSTKGGPIVLGRIVPGLLACIGIASVTGGIVVTEEQGWPESSATSVFFIVIAVLSSWLVWKFLRTAWLIVLVDDTFTCLATLGSWTFAPGQILAVRGDVYHQFLHFVGTNRKVVVWAQMDDRETLFAAICRANPSVEFAPWLQQDVG